MQSTLTTNPSTGEIANGVIDAPIGCLEAAMAIIGNKWTALILRDLSSGAKRFCEVERMVGGINPRTLSQRLIDLEEHGIIVKRTLSENPQRGCYELTQKGQDLIPVLQHMAEWGAKYHNA